jgi:hypothetical protein
MRSATSPRPDAAEIDLAQARAALRSTESHGDVRATELRDAGRLGDALAEKRRALVWRLSRRFDSATLASLATIGLAIDQVEAVLKEAARHGPI